MAGDGPAVAVRWRTPVLRRLVRKFLQREGPGHPFRQARLAGGP